jgi:hypothetical protein
MTDDKPLTVEEQKAQMSDLAWANLTNVFASGNPPEPEQPLSAPEAEAEALTEEDVYRITNEHLHGPFVFLLNPNHNALRGCVICGQAWVGAMAGTEDSIRWHVVQEVPDEEE